MANTITAVAKFHGYTDIVEPMKMSVPIQTIRPASKVPGRVFLRLREPYTEADRLVVGASYAIVITPEDRSCQLLRTTL